MIQAGGEIHCGTHKLLILFGIRKNCYSSGTCLSNADKLIVNCWEISTISKLTVYVNETVWVHQYTFDIIRQVSIRYFKFNR
jgi:hypothetical protein